MYFKARFYATAALVTFVALASSASAQTTPIGTSGGTTIFPPKNPSAGGGLLAFPPGYTNSVYAFPVLSDPNLISDTAAISAAINAQGQQETTAINNQTAAINSQAATIAGAINSQTAQIVAVLKSMPIGTSTGGGGGGDSMVSYPPSITCNLTIPAGTATTVVTSAENSNSYELTLKWAAQSFPAYVFSFTSLYKGEYSYTYAGSKIPSIYPIPTSSLVSAVLLTFNYTYSPSDPTWPAAEYNQYPGNTQVEVSAPSSADLIYDAHSGQLLNSSLASYMPSYLSPVFGSASNYDAITAGQPTISCPQQL